MMRSLYVALVAMALAVAACAADEPEPGAEPADPPAEEEAADEAADDEAPEDETADDVADGEGERESVTFRLDTSILPKHSIFFAADGLGFYDEVGLDVEILPSTGSYDTSIAVGEGQAEFGFADFGTMAMARAEGAEVKQLAVIHAESPFAVVTTADSDIETWEDLEGKRIAGEPAGSTTILFPLALEMAGMSEDDVEIISVDPTAKIPGMLADQWDASLAYFVSDPAVMIGQGVEPHSLLWSEVGFELYSNGLITTDEMIEENPDVVSRFVEATVKGVKWACDNPEPAAQNLIEQAPEISLVAAEAGVDLACGIVWTPEAEENGLGYMTDEGAANVIEITQDFLELEADFEPTELFTNDHNPGVLPGDTVEAPGA